MPPTNPDEALEIADFEFAPEATNVTVLEVLDPGQEPSVEPFPETSAAAGADSIAARPLRVTFRNSTDDAAIITGISVVIHELITSPYCGKSLGGWEAPSVNYNFRFPPRLDQESQPWSATNPENFSVPAHSVDAMSITIGPAHLRVDLVEIWKFSIYGITKPGTLTHWGSGIGMSYDGPWDMAKLLVLGTDDVGSMPAGTRACVEAGIEELVGFARPWSGGPFVVDPNFDDMVDAYRGIAEAL